LTHLFSGIGGLTRELHGEMFKNIHAIACPAEPGYLYMANRKGNAIYKAETATGKVGLFAQSPRFFPNVLRFYEGQFLYASDLHANVLLRVPHSGKGGE
jgi:hypothetical protein